MRPPPIQIRQRLRGPLLALVIVLIAVIAIELTLLARLGFQVARGQRLLSEATAKQTAALEMEISAREQDMALFRYLRTGDEVHLEHLADSWVSFDQKLNDFREGLPPGSREELLTERVAMLAAEADSLAGVLIMLRQHKTDSFTALQLRLDRAAEIVTIGRGPQATEGEAVTVANLTEVRQAVSAYIAVPDPGLREAADQSLRRLSAGISSLQEFSDEPAVVTLLQESADLGQRVLETQDAEAAQFDDYATVLLTLSEGALHDGLREATAQRQAEAREHLRALARRSVIQGLVARWSGGPDWPHRRRVALPPRHQRA